MASWTAWYAQFMSKTIFGGGGPSYEYKAMPVPVSLQWIGRTMRCAFYKEHVVTNRSFELCWKNHDWDLPDGYGVSQPNIKAGYTSFWKYDRVQPSPLLDEWALSLTWVGKHFAPYMSGSQIISAEMALREMNLNTSVGAPWNMKYVNKREFLADEKASAVLPAYWEHISETYPCEITPLWAVAVKGGEILKMAKIVRNDLRTYTASPIEHAVALNRMCLHQNEKFYAAHGKTFSIVGMNKFMRGWEKLHRKLDRHPNGYSVDEKRYDASLFEDAMWGQRDLRWEFLAPEHKTSRSWNALTNLYAALIYAVCVLGLGDLIRKLTGNPSGSVLTVVDNTMILIRLFCYAWIVLRKAAREKYFRAYVRANRSVANPDKGEYDDYSDDYGYLSMMRNTSAAGYGDDLGFSVSNAVNEWFNAKAIAEVWSTHCLVETTSDCWTPEAADTLWILSQGFVMIMGLHLPTPNPEKVLASLYLGSPIDDVRWHLLRAIALRDDSWANVECRMKIQTYIDFLNTQYRSQMVGEVRGIPIQEIHAMWKSDAELWAAYSGEEGAEL